MNMKTMKHLFALVAATVFAFGVQAASTTRYWVGGTGSEESFLDYCDAGNWSPSKAPQSGDKLYYTNSAYVVLKKSTNSGSGYFYNYVFVQNDSVLTFSSTWEGTMYYFVVNNLTLSDTSKLRMAGCYLASRSSSPTLSDVEIVGGTSNVIETTSSLKRGWTLSKVSGAGVLELSVQYGVNMTLSDITEFTGTLISSVPSAYKGYEYIATGAPGADIIIHEDNYMKLSSKAEYAFGTLTGGGTIRGDYTKLTLGKASDFDANVTMEKSADVEKVGAGTMNYGLAGCNNLIVSAGAVAMIDSTHQPSGSITFKGGALCDKGDDALVDVSAKIADSTSAITIDIANDVTFATVLADSNEAGLTKKGTGTLSLAKGQTLNGPLVVEGGKIGIVEALSGGDETLLTWTTEGSSVALEDFAVTVEAPFELKMVDDEGLGTTSLVVSHPETSFTWTGADDNRWENAKNWLVNGAATEFYPGASDTVVIALENQTIAITPSVAFGTFQTLADTTQFTILFSNEGDTYTIPTDKVSAEKFSVAQPFMASAVLSEGVYTAGARVSATYTWAGKDGAWNDAKNWRISGAATGVYPIMVKTYNDENGTADSATFNASTTVTLTENAQISTLTIADGVRVAFASDVAGTLRDLQVLEYGCGASSTMVLAFVNVFPRQNQTTAQTLTVGGYVEIVDGTTNGIYATSWRVNSSNKPASDLELTGNLIGGGALKVGANNSQRRGYFYFNGDNSAFTGVVLGTHYSSDGVQWCSENAGSASAIWNLSQLDSKALKITSPAGTTNKFGRLISNGVTLGNSNGAILEIGALGGESTLDLASGTFDVIKVGSGNLTIDGNQTGNVRIEAGTVTMGSAEATLLSVNRAFTFAGGTLVNAYGTDMSPYIANCATTTSAIVINDCGVDAFWATALPSAAQGGFTKKGTGTLALTAVPAYSGATIVEEGTLLVPMGTVIDTLDVGNGAKLGLYATTNLTEVTKVFTISNLAEGVELATAIPNTGATTYTFEQDTETGVWTVKAVRASVFTWSGAVDTAWENADNWLVNGSAVTEIPTSADTVVFPTKDEGNWSVTVSRDTHIVGMTNNAPVTLTGEGDIYLGSISSELEDAPALTLGDNATIRSENQRDAVLTIDVPLNIAASAEYPAGVYGRWMKDTGGNSSLYINREVLGDGCVEMKQSRGGIYFNGTNTAFAGTLTVFDDSSLSGATRTSPRFVLPESTSSNAVWNITNYTSLLQDGGKTYYFGGLSGSVRLNTTQSDYKQNTLEIGARDDVDSVLNGDFFANSFINLAGERGNTIRKVGNSTLTTTAIHVRAYELNGGLTVLNHNRAVHTRWNGEKTEVTEESEAAEHCYDIPITFGGGVLALGDDVIVDPSTNIVNSTAPIAFSNATDRTWASPLAASNVGGLTKKGAGALTLAEIPLYTGVTRVEAGELVVPDGTQITLDAASAGTITGATVTNAVFTMAETTTNVVETATLDKAYDCPVEFANITVDLSEKTDWTKGATYYVKTSVGIVAGTSARKRNCTLVLPEDQKGKWTLRIVGVSGGKKVFAVVPRGGISLFIR